MVLGKLEAARIALELPDNYNINDLMQILLRDLNLDSADQLDALASFRADKTNTTHSEA
jgi:hypothetical protein